MLFRKLAHANAEHIVPVHTITQHSTAEDGATLAEHRSRVEVNPLDVYKISSHLLCIPPFPAYCKSKRPRSIHVHFERQKTYIYGNEMFAQASA